MSPEEIRRRARQKAVRLENMIVEVEKQINKSSSILTRSILRLFLQKLKSENGKISPYFNTNTNTLFSQAFNVFINTEQKKLIKHIVGDFENIVGENENFYRDTATASEKTQKSIRNTINRRLGISEDGKLIKNGYMSGMLDDSQIRSQIQQFIYKEVMKGVGYEDLRQSVKMFIQGNDEKLGMFNRYYRAFSYDTYAQINSLVGVQYAKELGLEYFIYNGGIMETSRKFCIERNGKVFSSKEADKWVDDESLTAIESKDTYEWRIDRGGYNCRHSIDYISEPVAFALRPDLKELKLN